MLFKKKLGTLWNPMIILSYILGLIGVKLALTISSIIILTSTNMMTKWEFLSFSLIKTTRLHPTKK